jgi:hypothetical protein
MTRPADTGRVYRAIWRKVKAGFEVETRSRPPLIGAGKTYDGAIEALQVEILSRTGDGEAYVDVQKPPGPSDQVLAPYFKGRMFGVSGNDNAVVTNIDALFTGGLCSSCGNPAGPRTGVTAQLKRAPLAAGAVVVAMRACIYARAFVEAVEEYIPRKLFRPMDALPVGQRPRTQPFYELDVDQARSPVAVRLPLEGGHQCPSCGYRSLRFSRPGWGGKFVDATLAKEPFLVLGMPRRSGTLLLRADLWERLRSRQLSKIIGQEAPVVPRSLVSPTPKLGNLAGSTR